MSLKNDYINDLKMNLFKEYYYWEKIKRYNARVVFLSKFIPFKNLRRKFRKKYKLSRYELNQKKFNLGVHSYLTWGTDIKNAKETTVGKYCSIAREVLIGVSQHPIDRISSHTFTYSHKAYGMVTPIENTIPDEHALEPVKIGNDVWIGARAIIMDGVTIGDGAVIGGGAIVTKDVEPYTIVAGVPARPLRKRFSQEIIDRLLDLKWWDYPEDFIVTLPFDNIEKCIEMLEEYKTSLKGSTTCGMGG